MDQQTIERALADLPFSAVHYYPVIDSTNDEAARWAEQGAPDLALVIADEQTAGKGRAGRRWYTVPGSALAFSLILEPQASNESAIQRFTAVGALAVQTVLKEGYALPAQIKWPNDVLIGRLKVAGVLAEAHWMGDQLKNVILGIGINIAPPSIVWALDEVAQSDIAITCLQDAAGKAVDRLEVLRKVLEEMLVWRSHLDTADFINAWESRLAFRDEWVIIYHDNLDSSNISGANLPAIHKGQILGLSENGSLILRLPDGEIVELSSGDVQVRPMTDLKPGI
jgi:BirA family biotin operon repressor/biotin-[acetyl-CoA-carboxylase] ligase